MSVSQECGSGYFVNACNEDGEEYFGDQEHQNADEAYDCVWAFLYQSSSDKESLREYFEFVGEYVYGVVRLLDYYNDVRGRVKREYRGDRKLLCSLAKEHGFRFTVSKLTPFETEQSN